MRELEGGGREWEGRFENKRKEGEDESTRIQ